MSKDLLVLADEYAAATATFARALALKDGADSMSPIARDAGDKRAVLAEALAALDTAQPVPVNEWKAAVIDALVVAHILTPENAIYPRKAVQDVIDWNCQVALDPRVSLKAQALVDSGKSVQVNAMLVGALEEARNGLAWYQAMYPGATDGSDDEAMERIEAALATAEHGASKDTMKLHIRQHLANRYAYTFKEFCEKLGEILYAAPIPQPTEPAPSLTKIEDPVTVPRGLLGAACRAIAHKDDAPNTLEQLRQYTVGNLSPSMTGKAARSLDKAWSLFCSEIGEDKSPYPGMIVAFEAHYGQSFKDKDWRNEASVWAQAWSAATRAAHGIKQGGQHD